MKIIDLLNKIANGEEVPKKIKWENIIYAYSEYDKDYLECPFSDEEYKGLFDMKDSILTQFLNDEVEIIEEPKKIKKIKQLNNVAGCKELIELEDKQQINNHILKDKINELIDEINNLKEKKEEQEE